MDTGSKPIQCGKCHNIEWANNLVQHNRALQMAGYRFCSKCKSSIWKGDVDGNKVSKM